MGIPRCDIDDPTTYSDSDVVILGAPVDSGTSHRSGAKFGPQAIRGGDYLPHDGERPHLTLRVDALTELKSPRCLRFINAWGDLVASLAVLASATENFHVPESFPSFSAVIIPSHLPMFSE